MGFFTKGVGMSEKRKRLCRNPFQGGMGFFTSAIPSIGLGIKRVAIPFRVGWGFSLMAYNL